MPHSSWTGRSDVSVAACAGTWLGSRSTPVVIARRVPRQRTRFRVQFRRKPASAQAEDHDSRVKYYVSRVASYFLWLRDEPASWPARIEACDRCAEMRGWIIPELED